MEIGGKSFDVSNRTYIMGILNVTPDSFSDGGRFNGVDKALAHCERMIEEGADIIDIGGESTRPGFCMIDSSEEIRRIAPVIEAVKKRFDIPVSADTYKAETARAALCLGADLINDIWGLKYDKDMANVIKEYDVPCILMHNKEKAEYGNFVRDVVSELGESVAIAENAGIDRSKLIVDPGVGFGKTYGQNLMIIRELERLGELKLPVLLGVSRKSVIGLTLGLPVDKRLEGTIAANVIGVMKGAAFLRVHDVAENKRAVAVAEAVMGRKNGLDQNR